MDVSEQYIKMSEDWGLQTGRETQAGDYYCHSIRGGHPDRQPFIVTEKYCFYDANYYTWLPRQDQLQDMIGIERNIEWTIQTKYGESTWGYGSLDNDSGFYDETGFWDTLEKMWLSWYMKEKHNKIWDGDKWQ